MLPLAILGTIEFGKDESRKCGSDLLGKVLRAGESSASRNITGERDHPAGMSANDSPATPVSGRAGAPEPTCAFRF
jgi:hypothetical protein